MPETTLHCIRMGTKARTAPKACQGACGTNITEALTRWRLELMEQFVQFNFQSSALDSGKSRRNSGR